MKCEIEFLPVGEGAKAGDAIIVRYGDDNVSHLMLIDGGHTGTGDEIVAHLKRHFGPYPVLQHIVLTHSDADHASGLRTVLKEVTVKHLWLHVPWLLAEEARGLFSDRRWTEDGLRRNIKAEYDIVAEIFDTAVAAQCPVYYPFTGAAVGPFTVLSPSREAYRYLLPQFDKTPDPDQPAIEAAGMWLGKQSWMSRVVEAAKAAIQSWTTETWDYERLRDGGITSASNESSVVLYGSFERGSVLLTGDAGICGLNWAANAADAYGLPLRNFRLAQVPHHGSRRNVGPTILTRLLGDKQQQNGLTRFSAIASAPKDDAQHPRRIVTNAFQRRGGFVCATQGESVIYRDGFSGRYGEGPAPALPFYTRVEEYT